MLPEPEGISDRVLSVMEVLRMLRKEAATCGSVPIEVIEGLPHYRS